MSTLTSKVFLKDTVERAVKTFAQTLIAAIGAPAALAAVTDIDWGDALSIGATATILSVLTSVVSSGVGNNGTASVVPQVVSVDPTL